MEKWQKCVSAFFESLENPEEKSESVLYLGVNLAIARNAVNGLLRIAQAGQIEKNRVFDEIVRAIWQSERGQKFPSIRAFVRRPVLIGG